MLDNEGKSIDISSIKLDQLKELMPELFTEGKLDFENIKKFFGNDENLEERYGLNRVGKTMAVNASKNRTSLTLHPEVDNSVDWDVSNNIFIEGDNLDVLKILQKSYYNKIKMIYIDPPYNTGSDAFVYPDDYSMTREEYDKLAGNMNEDGNLKKDDHFRKNSKESGRYHSNWLSMMYPRLFLARNLLKDDGIIFVSIDDNEVHNLRLLMNEIYGEENFVGSFIRRNKAGGGGKQGKNDPNKQNSKNEAFVTDHEYILVYVKMRDYLDRFNLDLTDEDIAGYKNLDNDPKGVYKLEDLERAIPTPISTMYYDLLDPDGIVIKPKGGRFQWRYSQDRALKSIKEGSIIWIKVKCNKSIDSRGYYYRPKTKQYLFQDGEQRTKSARSIIYDLCYTRDGAINLRNLFDIPAGGIGYFENPKPHELIKFLIKIATNKDDLVMDFFSGSGTTSHAVMELNNEDQGSRRWICVQFSELTEEGSEAYKAGYKSIPEIARERIKRVGEKIKKESKKNTGNDFGYKSFVVGLSNFKQRRTNEINNNTLFSALEDRLQTIKSHGTNLSMIYELILKFGISLSEKIKIKSSAKSEYFELNNGELIVCLERKITQDLIDYLLKTNVKKIIMLDLGFHNNDQLLKNTYLQCENKKITLQIL